MRSPRGRYFPESHGTSDTMIATGADMQDPRIGAVIAGAAASLA